MSNKLPLPSSAIIRGDRVFVALQKAGRVPPGRSAVFHAVAPYCRPGLCADEPGTRSGWAEPPAEEVTCPVCIRRLEQLKQWRRRR